MFQPFSFVHGSRFYQGVLCFWAREAVHLARRRGLDDLLVAYPTPDARAMTEVARLVAEGQRRKSPRFTRLWRASTMTSGRWGGQVVPGPPVMPGIWGEIAPQPRGTVLILGPWNDPVTNLLSPFMDALAAGNTAFLKPSERAPATAQVMQELIDSTFGPKRVMVGQGDAQTAQQLTHLPFDYIRE